MRLALIQNHCSPDRNENLERALNYMEQAKESGADMVVFPELAVDRFFPQHEEWNAREIAEPIPGPTTRAIGAKAKSLSLVTVFNLYEEAVAGRYFDSSPVFDADGMLLGVTRMVHITDYACFHEKAYYSPGDNGARVYDTAVGRVGVAICHDRHYPEYMRTRRARSVTGGDSTGQRHGRVTQRPLVRGAPQATARAFQGPLGRSGKAFRRVFLPPLGRPCRGSSQPAC